uniref:ATP synthase complex subunit 8 n=1 Tax=Eoscarta assimilis TaxID=2815129 RepID=A0A8F6D504_9HEMI|nr:ATP synthase F0 subunit 8 [Eoscarta assimilis]
MPQMAPMSWMILFLMFINSYLIMNMMIYFFYKFKNMNLNKNNSINQMNWKW